MATPHHESFCCAIEDNISDYQIVTYNAICLVSSTLSIQGSLFMLYQLRRNEKNRLLSRPRKIIFWLTICDLLACLGVFIRSIVWLVELHNELNEEVPFLCLLVDMWVQLFYLCTYMWTAIYAIDVYASVQDKEARYCFYHSFAWIVPVSMVSVGMIPVQLNSGWHCETSKDLLLVRYLTTYVPMLVTMLLNPVLYWLTWKRVVANMKAEGTYATQERIAERSLRWRMGMNTLIFCVCWLPSIANGIWQFVSTGNGFIFELWIAEALLNPLQGLLNAIFYSQRKSGSTNRNTFSSVPHKTYGHTTLPGNIPSSNITISHSNCFTKTANTSYRFDDDIVTVTREQQCLIRDSR